MTSFPSFYHETRRKYIKKKSYAPEYRFGFDEYIQDWHPRRTQVLQDIFTVLCIVLMSRILKKGFYRIWMDFRRFLGWKMTPFEKKLEYRRMYWDPGASFYHNKLERFEYMYTLAIYFEHVTLYGFERYSCHRYKYYVKPWYANPYRQVAVSIYNNRKSISSARIRRYVYFRPDYS